MWESEKNTRKQHIQDSQEVSPFPAGGQKAASTRRQAQNTNAKTRFTKEAPPRSAQKKSNEIHFNKISL